MEERFEAFTFCKECLCNTCEKLNKYPKDWGDDPNWKASDNCLGNLKSGNWKNKRPPGITKEDLKMFYEKCYKIQYCSKYKGNREDLNKHNDIS